MRFGANQEKWETRVGGKKGVKPPLQKNPQLTKVAAVSF